MGLFQKAQPVDVQHQNGRAGEDVPKRACRSGRAGAGVPKRVKVQMGSREDFALFDGEQRPWPGHMPHGQGHKESHQWKKKATGGAVEKSGCCQLAGIVTDVLLQPII